MNIFTTIRTTIRCQVARGVFSAIFFLAFITLLNAAPAKSGSKADSTGKAATAKSEESEAAANKEAETESPQAESTQTADQENEAEDGSDPDMPTFRHGNIKVGMDEETYLKLRTEHIMRLRGLSDPSKVDPHARGNAIRVMERQETRQAQELKARTGPSDTGPPPSGTTWTEIGPSPIPNGQTSPIFDPAGEFPVSGRVTAIAVHASNSNILYVGAAQGGVYRSLDGGATWTPLLDSALSLAVGAIAIAPSQPTTIYVGTGEANLSADSFFGVGVYRIDNADTSPVLVGPLNKDGLGNDVMTGRAISQILVHPTDPNTIFVSTTSGVGGIGGQGFNILPARGVFRSTNAAGPGGSVTFTKLTVATVSGNRSITDIAMDPGNPANIIAAVFGNAVAGDGGYYRSINALDPTPTFTQTLILNAVTMKFAINKVGSVVTVLAGSGDNVGGRLRRSVDGGATWSATIPSANGYCGNQCFYDANVAMHPGNANIIFTGGPGNPRILRKSTDGAVSFLNVGTMLHADTHAIVFDPSNPTVMYTGDDGGIFKSTDSGNTWTSLNNSTFSATQFQSLSLHPRDREFMIGGTQDNGTEFRKPDSSWTRADFGDGGFALVDQSATDTNTVTMYHTYFNQTNNLIGFARNLKSACADEGDWAFLGPFADDPAPVCDGSPNTIFNGMSLGDSVLFYAPMALGPGTPNTVYYGSDRLYRSSNRGNTMTVVSQAPLIAGPMGNPPNVPISAIGISAQNDNVRIVGMANGKVFATTTGSSTLTNVTGPIPGCYVARAVVDPNNVDTAYVTLSCFGLPAGQHVWKTTNLSGAPPIWTASGSGIPDVPTNAFAIDPRDSTSLYAGTDIGVYHSTDSGATWNPYGTGLPRVAVFDMAIQSRHRVLRVATHGRGIWEIGITPVGPPTIDKAFGVDHIPLNGTTSLTFTLSNPNSAPTTLTGIGFTDTLPAGLVLSTPSNLTGSCGGGTITAPDGGTTISLSGATLASGEVCTFSVNVNGTIVGLQTNTTSAVTCVEAGAGETATANLTVGLAPAITKGFSPMTVPFGGTSTLTFNVSNPNTDITLSGIAFTDTLPTATPGTLRVATPNNLTNTCGGTATAVSGSPTISLSGVTLAATASCTVSASVQGTAVGDAINSVTVTDTTTGTGNTSTATLTVTKANTTTTVTSSLNPSVFGQSVTFTATVAATPPGAGTPTGTVTFLDGANPIGTGTLSGGVATFTTSALLAGNHVITTTYPGDVNFNSSAGSLTGNPQVVNKANTTTPTVTSSVNPSVVGQFVTFTATVTATPPGAGTPTGVVLFKDGASTIGSGGLISGVTTFSTTTLALGSHTITTTYGGDANFNGSTGSLTGNPQVVNKASTIAVVSSSNNPSTFGQSVTFTATVAIASPGSGTATGTVTFKDGASTLGTGTLSGGVATFTTSALAAGNHSITGVYGGDANFNGTTGSLDTNPQVVNQSSTTTGVASNNNPSLFGQSVMFTATVTAVPPGAGTPTGTVTFKDGASTLGTGTLSAGVATFTTSSLTAGIHSITAVYGGDANFSTSTSAPLTQTVHGADISVTLTHVPDPANIGGRLTFSAVVTNNGPDSANVTFAETFVGTSLFVSSSSTLGTCSGSGPVNCNLGSMNSGDSATVTVVVTPLPLTRTITATGTAASDATETNPANNTAINAVRVRFRPFHF